MIALQFLQCGDDDVLLHFFEGTGRFAGVFVGGGGGQQLPQFPGVDRFLGGEENRLEKCISVP